MTPPLPSNLSPRTARWQVATVLALFYGMVYGPPVLVGGELHRVVAPILSSLILGTLMLLVVISFVRRDASWRESLGLGRQPVGQTLAWSGLGFLGAYLLNLTASLGYLVTRGDLGTQIATRATGFASLADLPVASILPLAAFAGFWEETVFRGLLLGRLRAAMPCRDTREAAFRRDALAVVLSALFFGAGHGYQGTLGLVQTTAAGLALGGLVIWRQSLWPAIGAHLAIDVFGLLLLRMLRPFMDTFVRSGFTP